MNSVRPIALDVDATFRLELGKDKTLFVSIYTSDMGKKHRLAVSTSGKTGGRDGHFNIDPADLRAVTDFIQAAGFSFEQLIQVNGALLEPQKREDTDGGQV